MPLSPTISLLQSASSVERGSVQSKNFEFLRNARADLAALGGFAEHYAFNDPAGSLFKRHADGFGVVVGARHICGGVGNIFKPSGVSGLFMMGRA